MEIAKQEHDTTNGKKTQQKKTGGCSNCVRVAIKNSHPEWDDSS
jgi:hypothetical protein